MQSATESSPASRRHGRKTTPPYLNYFLSDTTTKSTGFVPRRKHQKSRRGCTTCKKRHIRCDETFPRCDNCTKYQSDCNYPDAHHEAAPRETAPSTKSSGSLPDGIVDFEATDEDQIMLSLEDSQPASGDSIFKKELIELDLHSLNLYDSSTTPMTTAKREQLALLYTEVVCLSLPIPAIRDSWNQSIIPLAIKEPMLLHMCLSIASSHLQALRNTPLADCREMIYSNKMAAISLVNQELDKIQGASESMLHALVATIIMLLGQEITLDHDASAVCAHMLGLRDLVKFHGGFKGIPSPFVNYIYIIDCAYSATCRCRPAFPLHSYDQVHTPINRAVERSEQYLNPSFLTQRYHKHLHTSLLSTYQDLSLVFSIQERAIETSSTQSTSALTSEEMNTYGALRITTLQKLITFLVDHDERKDDYAFGPTGQNSALTPIQSICRVVVPFVALQYQFLLYRRAVYTVPMLDCLYETLNFDIDLEACWATYAEVMLWATMFGIYVSRGIAEEREKELWFLYQLVEGIRNRRGRTGQLGGKWKWEWNAVRDVLKRFYWSERFFGEEFEEICELLRPAITAPSNTPPGTIDHLILTACSTPDPDSQTAPDDNYGELIRCFANTRQPTNGIAIRSRPS